MNKNFSCPYCGQNSYAKTSKTKGEYTSWKTVRAHISKCSKNNNEYTIDLSAGPVHYSIFLTSKFEELKKLLPKSRLSDCVKHFKSKGLLPNHYYLDRYFSKQEIIASIQHFYKIHGNIPAYRDFYANPHYPHAVTVKEHFGSWNDAIEAAGYIPNIQNGFGYDTFGLDGHLYRSTSEAYFADNYLHKKYEYIIEPKYPSPYNKYYDWYIPLLDLYIELDGGIRPETTKDKIEINKLLYRNCLFIATKDIRTFIGL